jgi:putative restriction endonuclease
VWQFRLASADSTDSPDVDTWNQAPRVEATVQRIVRNTAMATNVKDMHNHTCQVCGQQLRTAAGLYAEAAHIRALGAPHHGPDALDNFCASARTTKCFSIMTASTSAMTMSSETLSMDT